MHMKPDPLLTAGGPRSLFLVISGAMLVSTSGLTTGAMSPYDGLPTAVSCAPDETLNDSHLTRESFPSSDMVSDVIGDSYQEPLPDPLCLPPTPTLLFEPQASPQLDAADCSWDTGLSEGDLTYLGTARPLGTAGVKTERGNHHYIVVRVCITPEDNLGHRYLFYVFEHTVNAKDHLSHHEYQETLRADMLELKTVDAVLPFEDHSPDRTKSSQCKTPLKLNLGVGGGGVSAGLEWTVPICERKIWRDYFSGEKARWYTQIRDGNGDHLSQTFSYGVVQDVPPGVTEAGIEWSARSIHHKTVRYWQTDLEGTISVTLEGPWTL